MIENPASVPAQTNRLALTFIFITMFLDTVGLGIIIPVAPRLIAELTGHPGTSAVSMSAAAWWGGWLGTAFAGMLFLFSPLIGNLSDRFGRRPVLITSVLALGIDYLITGLAPTIWWLFVGRILSGIAGAAYTTANAYIADVTPPEKRAANFGLVGAAFGIGFVVGPAIGGLLGRFQHAAAVLRGGRIVGCERAVRLAGAERISAAREAAQIRILARQPVGRVACDPPASHRARLRRCVRADAAGARRQSDRSGATTSI